MKFKARTGLFSLSEALRLKFKDSSQGTDSKSTDLKVAEASKLTPVFDPQGLS